MHDSPGTISHSAATLPDPTVNYNQTGKPHGNRTDHAGKSLAGDRNHGYRSLVQIRGPPLYGRVPRR